MEAQSSLVKDPLNFYKSVHPDKEIIEASKKSSDLFSHFSTEFWMRKDFFELVNKFYKKSIEDGSFEKLDAEN